MLFFTTVDNPGWYLEVTLSQNVEEQSIVKIDDDDTRWVHCFTRDNQWIAAGDETKLVRIFHETLKYFNIPLTNELEELVPLLEFVQMWYANECNGDWEHSFGVSMTINKDNCCHIIIDLNETYWEDYALRNPIGSLDTFQCYTKDLKFIGDGQLVYIKVFLETFKAWIEYCMQLED